MAESLRVLWQFKIAVHSVLLGEKEGGIDPKA